MVALTGGMFLSGHTAPRLGIDLAGGTSITLEAQNQPGKPNAINPTNMDTAVGIIERRVNGLGVSEAEVQTQGDRNIIVNIPKGTDSKQAQQQVGTTAQLYFRPVLTVAASGPAPSASRPLGQRHAERRGVPEERGQGRGGHRRGGHPSPSSTTQGRAVTGALKAPRRPHGLR